MGNGIFNCKGCNEYCKGKTNIEINNELYENYGEINLDKMNHPQRIITNIYIPNYNVEYSPDTYINPNIENQIQTTSKKFKTEKHWEKYIKEVEYSQNNFVHYYNEAIKMNKNISLSPSITKTISINEKVNKTMLFNNYILEMLNYINKLRNTPKSVMEDIDSMIKNNLKEIDDKKYLISDNTNEMIKLSTDLEKIKEILNIQQPFDKLKIENKLKINYYFEKLELDNKTINELIVEKKRKIIHEYPECFFYPTFIKDIKINIILLLENNSIKEKIFYDGFSDFYVTTFNERNNRFLAILCLA